MSRLCMRNIAFMALVLSFGACASSRPKVPTQAPTIIEIDYDILDDAPYKTAKPRNWNKKILLLAPGSRFEKLSRDASFDTMAPFEFQLLEDGWLIAITSYRRNGLLLEDGIVDIQNLIYRIEKVYGPAETLIIEGSSMGATIGVKISEGSYFPKHLQVAVVAIGASFDWPARVLPMSWTHQPRHPVLMMSNTDEWDGPKNYTRNMVRLPASNMHPVLWRLPRNGHVNTNAQERLAAVEAVLGWLEEGQKPPVIWPEGWNAGVNLGQPVSQAEQIEENIIAITVTEVDRVFGNLTTNMVQADLDLLPTPYGENGYLIKHGIRSVDHFFALGSSYSSVDEGKAVAFFTAEGYLQLAVNMGSAAYLLDCSPGSILRVSERKKVNYRDTVKTQPAPEPKKTPELRKKN